MEVVQHHEHYFRQAGPGRPGPKTRYVRKTRRSWRLQWHIDEEAIACDRKSDGMYPLLTNDSSLTDAQVLGAHKHQPTVEKRFEQTKTVFEIALAMSGGVRLVVDAWQEKRLLRRWSSRGMICLSGRGRTESSGQ